MLFYRKGACKPKRKEKETCIPLNQKKTFTSIYGIFGMCPCESGLECESKAQTNPLSGIFDSHTNGICQKTVKYYWKINSLIVEKQDRCYE